MKHKLYLFLILIGFQCSAQVRFNPYVPQNPYGILSTSQTVYICTGSYAYAYHSRSNCTGLNNCRGEVKYTNEDYAISGLKRKPCCICWSNVKSNCHDDNTTYKGAGGSGGGSGNSDAQAAVGLALLVGSVAVLSNDFYAHYTHNIDANLREIQPSSFSFGFRKLLGESALEYGATYNNPITKTVFIGNYGNGYYQYPIQDVTKSQAWNFNLNYLQKIYSLGRYDDVILYLGPVLNYTEKTGFGGIFATQYRLGKVGKLDLRYELTSETHRISLGLILHYQDKYFWQ